MSQKRALVCLPSNTIDRGLRLKDLGKVNIQKAKRQHQSYCRALKSLGYELITLPANDVFPDSVFVEDPAIIIKDTLVVTRLRRAERRGEEEFVRYALSRYFNNVLKIQPPGFVEGGDVLVTDTHLYIGLSGRTNINGAIQLAQIAKNFCGIESVMLEIPKNWLHLKGGVSFHPHQKLIITNELICKYFTGSGYQLLPTPDNERFGANCVSDESTIYIHDHCPATKKALSNHGYLVREINFSEFKKIDGAMTCLSKLF